MNKYTGWTTAQLVQALNQLDETMDGLDEPVPGEPVEVGVRRLYKTQVDLIRLQTELARRMA